jgi:hypothetical protein
MHAQSHAQLKLMEIDMNCFGDRWQLECERADGAKLRLSEQWETA